MKNKTRKYTYIIGIIVGIISLIKYSHIRECKYKKQDKWHIKNSVGLTN